MMFNPGSDYGGLTGGHGTESERDSAATAKFAFTPH